MSTAQATAYPEEKLFFLRRTHEHGSVYTYAFRPDVRFTYTAGQYAHLRVAGLPEGVRAVREYSFASAPHEEEILFGIDSRSGSEYQKKLEALTEGDEVTLFKIKGHLVWPSHDTELVMIAGGVGITPFRSILADKTHKQLQIKTTLIHASHDEYLYSVFITRTADQYIPVRRSDLLTAVEGVCLQKPQARYLIAGSLSFVASVRDKLQSNGIDKIEVDEFKGFED